MADSADSTPESMQDILAAWTKLGPDAMRAIAGIQPEIAQSQFKADELVSPEYARLNQSIYDTTGREQAKTTSEIDRANQLAGQETTRQLVSSGGDLVDSALALDKRADPNFYKNSDTVTKAITDLFAGQNPNALSGSERAEVERANARGGSFVPSANETVANAMTFGHELQNKQSRFSDSVAKAASAVPALRSGISGFNVATRGSTVPTQAPAGVPTGVSGAGQNAWNTSNQNLSSAWDYGSNIEGRKKDVLDQATGWGSMVGSAVGAIGGAI